MGKIKRNPPYFRWV